MTETNANSARYTQRARRCVDAGAVDLARTVARYAVTETKAPEVSRTLVDSYADALLARYLDHLSRTRRLLAEIERDESHRLHADPECPECTPGLPHPGTLCTFHGLKSFDR